MARVFIPFAFGFFLSYLYRTINAVIAPDLIADIGLNARELGLLTAAYFLAFASFQIPLGILLDRFGPRKVQVCLLFIAGLGALVFSRSTTTAYLITGRALIGFGVSGALMSSFKAIVQWFPRQRLSLVNGCLLGFGGMGAVVATVPVEFMVGFIGWRGVFGALGALTFLVAVIILFFVPEKDTGETHPSLSKQVRELSTIYRDGLFRRLAPVHAMSTGTALSIHGLWAGPWLKDVGRLDREDVALQLLFMSIALTFGFVLSGVLADLLGRLGIRTVKVMAVGYSLFFAVQLCIILGVPLPVMLLWTAFGFLGNVGVLSYSVVGQHFPPQFAGRANTGVNVMVFMSAFFIQYVIGMIINLWPQSPEGGFDPRGYPVAFGTMLILQIVAFIWFLRPAVQASQVQPEQG